MNKITLGLSICLASFVSFAQDDYLLTIQGDTIRGKLAIINGQLMDEVRVKTDSGKSTYRIFHTKELRLADEMYVPIIYNQKRVFGKLVEQGTSLTYARVKDENSTQYNQGLLIKPDNSYLPISSIGLRARMMNFLDECESIVSAIEKKELPAADIRKVIAFYEANCVTDVSAFAQVQVVKPHNAGDANSLKSDAQLIIDIINKLESGDTVPQYMIEALEKVKEQSISEKIERLLEQLTN